MLTPERVRIPLTSRDKDGVLAELVDLVVEDLDLAPQREAIRRAVRQRENVLSTGIGEGVAVPHAKYEGLSRMVLAAGVSMDALEYGALDGRPVRLFFLILGPESSAGGQIRVLSRIGRMMRDEELRERLVTATSAETFLGVLAEAESGAWG